MRYSKIILTTAIYLSCQPTFAAGFGLNENSADAMAVSYAGSAATAADASYLAYNPASAADVNCYDSSVNAVAIFPTSRARYTAAMTSAGSNTGGSADPTSFVQKALVPEYALRARLSERWAIGLVVSAPWGFTTSYPSTWVGRYYAQTTRLMSVNAMPVVSYEVSPRLSVGAGLQIEYAHGKLTSAVDTGTLGYLYGVPGSIPGGQDSQATYRANSWGVGLTAGVLWQVDDRLRLGLSYRSSVSHRMKGPLTFALDSAGIGQALRSASGLFTDTIAKSSMTMPDIVRFGARYALNDRWTLLTEADWTNWHRFHELRIIPANPAQPDDVTGAGWGDGWFYSIGADYLLDEDWHVRAGAGYDATPIPATTLSPRIPDGSRAWMSVGARYQFSRTTTIDLSYAHLCNSDGHVSQSPTQIGNSLRGWLAGTTTSSINAVSLEISFHT
ncbi:MAG: outer membrane protein transport protein [Alphaproteobacteria bacterium]|nr:outer membrane protein transport protein [Alphaproteobacteria bacterium]